MYIQGLKILEWLHAPSPACQLTNLAPFRSSTSLQKHRLHCWASTPTAYAMSFTAPVISPPAPPLWARIRQQTLVYHEVTFFFASNDPQTIIDFWRSFITQWGGGIEYGREIHTEITWPGWYVHGGFFCCDYTPHLNPEDPRSTTIAANEENKFSYILRHRMVTKSVCTVTYLLDHASLLISQGVTIRLIGVQFNARYPHLASLPSRYQSWWYELNEDQDEDYSTVEDLHRWRQAATILNAIGGNNSNGSSHSLR